MNRVKRHEEVLSVTLPGGRLQLATVFVNATDTDEDVCKGISQIIGTIFRISGVSYKLTCIDPYRLKRLDVKKTRELTVDDPPEESHSEVLNKKPASVPHLYETKPLAQLKASDGPRGLNPEDFATDYVDSSEVQVKGDGRPEGLPKVGETWKPKDKRRSTTFRVSKIDGDFAVTEDNRRIQLARFCRYERISA